MFNKKTVLVVIGGAFVLALAIGGVALASFTRAEAQAATFGPANLAPMAAAAFGDVGEGGFAHRGGPRFPGKTGRGGDGGAYLAEALGITVDQLNEAQTAVREKAIDRALADGLITEAQAEALKEGKLGGRAAMLGAFLIGPEAMEAIDHEALLAEELGISAATLESAKETAADLAIQAKIDNGQLTEEQADMLKAHMALKEYIDKAGLFEDATGLTPEEFRQAMQDSLQAAVEQAVADGAITQEQADQILSGEGHPGLQGHPGFPGSEGKHGGRDGRGGFPRFPNNPDTVTPDSDA